MTTRERVGQLFIMGVASTGPSRSDMHNLIADAGGNVYLRGDTTRGGSAVHDIVAKLQSQLTHAGVRPFIGTDQEGGEVQDLQGPGFAAMPTAVAQGRLRTDTLQADAHTWGSQLRKVGLNLDLAPVADTVPKSVGTSNQPIGQYFREYGHTVTRVRRHVVGFERGLLAAHVATTLKHFPGLGRATGNTDNGRNITDPTGPRSPYLLPFHDGVRAGTQFVMVSSATYPHIDPTQPACFSRKVIHDLLRTHEKFAGIVVSDSFGSASVAYLRAGLRAIYFFRAGGTMVLDSAPAQLHTMVAAVMSRITHNAAFAATIKADVLEVLTMKAGDGLI
jgi:beta-N-acetylhexosaminidase